MKQLITFSPTFTPGAANTGTLDFTGLSGFNIKDLYAVVNVTRNALLYVPGTPQFGFSGFANNSSIITLAANTSTYSTSDVLQVFYDTNSGVVTAGLESNFASERGGNLQQHTELLKLILVELRVHSYLMQQGMYPATGTTEDVDKLRADLTAYDYDLSNQTI